MVNRKLILERIGKKIFSADTDGQLIQEFTDEFINPKDAKKIKLKNRGLMANFLATKIYEYLESYHIPTAFVMQLDERGMVIRNNKPIPLEVSIRIYANREDARHSGVKEGSKLEVPVLQLFLFEEKERRKVVTEENLVTSEIVTTEEMRVIKRIITKITALLVAYFNRRDLTLKDYTIQFAKQKNQIQLSSEFIPELCNFRNFDKDFTIQEKYHAIYNRLTE